jgi:DNA-binding NtrC family response regulator
MKERVLVFDDDSLLLEFLSDGLLSAGFETVRADSLSKCFRQILNSPPNIILAEYQLQDGTAFDLLVWLKEQDLRIPLIVVTGNASIELAVEAVKKGAERFITKPIDLGYLATELRRTLDSFRSLQKDLASKLEKARYERDPFIGTSPAIQELKKSAKRIAESSSTVLIHGETGTGKGVLARWIYKMGPRSREAFVDLNCAALSRDLLESELFGHQKGAFTGAVGSKMGLVEAANHGTLFLDEIGDLDLQVQPKILKVVEEKHFYRLGDAVERKVDVQIIAASHRDLKKMAEAGTFRTDLYFRVSTFPLRIPPLRERLEDIPVITDKLLEQLGRDMQRPRLRISDEALLTLQRYAWPGNIRELRNVLERATLLSDDDVIQRTCIDIETPARPGVAANAASAHLTLKEMEKQYIRMTLDAEGGNVVRAAKRLGIPRSSLYVKIREHQLLS